MLHRDLEVQVAPAILPEMPGATSPPQPLDELRVGGQRHDEFLLECHGKGRERHDPGVAGPVDAGVERGGEVEPQQLSRAVGIQDVTLEPDPALDLSCA